MGGIYETLSGARDIRAQGKNQQRMEEYKAKVAEQEGKAELLRSGFDQMQQAKEAERIKGRIEANLGAAGAAGSPVAIDINREQAYESELENLLIGYEGQIKNQRAQNSAALSRLQGELYKQAGKAGARQANIGFGIQLAALAVAADVFSGGPGTSSVSPDAGFSYGRNFGY